jgi:hypothetical protein
MENPEDVSIDPGLPLSCLQGSSRRLHSIPIIDTKLYSENLPSFKSVCVSFNLVIRPFLSRYDFQ